MSDHKCRRCWAKGFDGCQCEIPEEPTSQSAGSADDDLFGPNPLIAECARRMRLIEKLQARIAGADELAEVIEHALELGHLGEGSTRGWAKQALEKYRGRDK
jgi:hypothetical protein